MLLPGVARQPARLSLCLAAFARLVFRSFLFGGSPLLLFPSPDELLGSGLLPFLIEAGLFGKSLAFLLLSGLAQQQWPDARPLLA